MTLHRIIGPLILIVIGVAFLMNNFVVDIPLWRLFADYWPVVLILVGVGQFAAAVGSSPARRWGHVTSGSVMVTLGLLFQLHELHVASFTRSWPALLIVLGCLGLVRALMGPALFPDRMGRNARGGFPR